MQISMTLDQPVIRKELRTESKTMSQELRVGQVCERNSHLVRKRIEDKMLLKRCLVTIGKEEVYYIRI
jgi:hypothetical protein